MSISEMINEQHSLIVILESSDLDPPSAVEKSEDSDPALTGVKGAVRESKEREREINKKPNKTT